MDLKKEQHAVKALRAGGVYTYGKMEKKCSILPTHCFIATGTQESI